MAVFNIATLLLVTIALAGIFLPGNRVAGLNCKGSLEDLILQCAKYVEVPGPIVAPSQACCNWVQQADIPCLCRNISNELELILSPEKVVYVAKYCQRPLQSGTKCGSYTVPKAQWIKGVMK